MTTRKNCVILRVIPVSIDIEKIRRVVVLHFISEKVLLLYWEMTLTILTAEWKLLKSIDIDKYIFVTDSNIGLGVTYRMPNPSVDVLNYRIFHVKNVIQKYWKFGYLWRDLNIDFLKAEKHRATGELLDVLCCDNVFTLITKLTRVTSTTAI